MISIEKSSIFSGPATVSHVPKVHILLLFLVSPKILADMTDHSASPALLGRVIRTGA